MTSSISRRSVIVSAGLLGVGGACGAGLRAFAKNGVRHDDAKKDSPENDLEKFEPHYLPVSPRQAAEYAYEFYPEGSCMYATIRSVITLIAEKDPSAVPPIYYDMFKYGHDGCGGCGTVCGMCNGGAAVIGLFHQDRQVRDEMIDELFRWYETSELPRYTPEGADTMPACKPDSVLCHVSMSNWCSEAEEDIFSDKRKERCRRMTADAAGKVVEILNARHQWEQDAACRATNPRDSWQSTPSDSCIQCHSVAGGEKKAEKEAPKSVARMNCAVCHDHDEKHPVGYE